MYYRLDPSFALRSWNRVPYALLRKDAIDADVVDEGTFRILCSCDGKTDIPTGRTVQRLLAAGIIRRCEYGGGDPTQWQQLRWYDNRYFPAVCWSITERCNFDCRHCFVGAGSADDAPCFTYAEAMAFLEACEQCGIHAFVLTGGEPLMHPDFLNILQEIYRRNMHVYMVNTNGSFITPDLLGHMKDIGCIPHLKISFDGIGRHDWLRRSSGAEQQVLRAIELSTAEGFPVTVQMNVFPGNLDCLEETLVCLENAGVQETRLIRTADAPKWNKNSDGSVLSFTEYFDAMLGLLDSFVRQQHRMGLDIWRFVRLDPSRKQYRISAIKHAECYSGKLPVCEGNRHMLSVTANGDMVPCHSFSGLYRTQGISLGNVKTQPLGALLTKSPYLDAVCETLDGLARQNHQCGRCRYFRYCCGGCRAMAALYGNTYYASDPMMCCFFQNRYDRKIRSLLPLWQDTLYTDIP
ncbi:MAG: radical SAM protein [Clostridia bacterium]|nr:radical SAM protein [Clostridia bacterium]